MRTIAIMLALALMGCGGAAHVTAPAETDCSTEIAAHIQKWGDIPYIRTDEPGEVTFVHTSADYRQTFVFQWGAGIKGCHVTETAEPIG
ncbi:MAG TPA: hypothetical protein VFW98_08410 [Gemmatimonadaceae bacterium]|nr:hypothetical protein [Gemmatimonadaceae bacterium]